LTLANKEQDWRQPSEPSDESGRPAPAPAGPVRGTPAVERSVWAQMVLSEPEDAGEPEPFGPAQPAADHSLHGPGAGWPELALPPSFGQRPVAAERAAAAEAGAAEGYRVMSHPYGYVPTGRDLHEEGELPGGRDPAGDTRDAVSYAGEPGGAVTYEAYDGYGTVAPDDTPPEAWAPEGLEQWPWAGESADSLTADVLLPVRHVVPLSGWRRVLYQVTGGLVRPPESAADRRRRELVLRARTPVAAGHHRVAVLSLKGGVGKTTTAIALGSTLASLRGDRVIAVDASPGRGTLCDKLRPETAATVRDLLSEEDQIRRYADVRACTSQAPSGLEVLASDRDPAVSVAFSDNDYERVAGVLERYYSICITDCGTGLLHSAMAGVLHLADQIVLVSSPSADGARSAAATLDWLAAHGHGDLVKGAVVVLCAVRPQGKSTVDLGRLEQHFAARCQAVVWVPYDAHLAEGAEIDESRLSRAAADAYLILAAELGDGFGLPPH
jgi:MinD-like ATPase involved in chromosome partitioning or flagellar assembly